MEVDFIALVDAERFNLEKYKDLIKCPKCNGDACVQFVHGPLTPGEKLGYALECRKCSALFHVNEEGKKVF